MTTEPHAVIFVGVCPLCGREGLSIVTIPKLATGEYFPQFGHCEDCGEVDLRHSEPIKPPTDRTIP